SVSVRWYQVFSGLPVPTIAQASHSLRSAMSSMLPHAPDVLHAAIMLVVGGSLLIPIVVDELFQKLSICRVVHAAFLIQWLGQRESDPAFNRHRNPRVRSLGDPQLSHHKRTSPGVWRRDPPLRAGSSVPRPAHPARRPSRRMKHNPTKAW